jgi:hypothetical protein
MRRRLVSAGQSFEARTGPVIWIESLPRAEDVELIDEIMADGAEELRADVTRGRDRRRPSTGRNR